MRYWIAMLSAIIIAMIVIHLLPEQPHHWKLNECIVGQSFMPPHGSSFYVCIESNTWKTLP